MEWCRCHVGGLRVVLGRLGVIFTVLGGYVVCGLYPNFRVSCLGNRAGCGLCSAETAFDFGGGGGGLLFGGGVFVGGRQRARGGVVGPGVRVRLPPLPLWGGGFVLFFSGGRPWAWRGGGWGWWWCFPPPLLPSPPFPPHHPSPAKAPHPHTPTTLPPPSVPTKWAFRASRGPRVPRTGGRAPTHSSRGARPAQARVMGEELVERP